MFELNVPSPKFLLDAISAGREARFYGAVVLLLRGLGSRLQEELAQSWSDIDDITHNDILVLTFGVTPRKSGITAYGRERHVVADGVSVAYPHEGKFSEAFEALLDVASYRPALLSGCPIGAGRFDSHGTTDMRRVLEVPEKHLPAILVIAYKEDREYLIELGLGAEQVSPVTVVSEIARELDDAPYRYRQLDNRITEMVPALWQLQSQIEDKKKRLRQAHTGPPVGQLESVVRHIERTTACAPCQIRETGRHLIDFLSGRDADAEVVEVWATRLIAYSASCDTCPEAARLPKKLRKALAKRLRQEPLEPSAPPGRRSQLPADDPGRLEEDIKGIEARLGMLQKERENLREIRASIKLESVFQDAVESALRGLGFQRREEPRAIAPGGAGQLGRLSLITYSPTDKTRTPLRYDVALSFAGEDRPYVEQVASALLSRGITVFYDAFEQVRLWGKDLYGYLDEIYRRRSRLCLMFISCHYRTKLWTNHERESAQARAFADNKEYILPIRFDDTDIPGVRETVAYVDARTTRPEDLADMVVGKLAECRTLEDSV